MSEQRRNQILEDFRRPPSNKSSRSKDLKNRLNHLRSKQTFLTDTQTSDYTKSSGEINLPRIEHLEETIRKLQKQNTDLKQRIVELKKNQFYEINQEKLKNMIKQADKLRHQAQKYKKDFEQSMVERDFLQRFNRNLKVQCQNLTKQILVLKGSGNSAQIKKNDKGISTARDQTESSNGRNSSNDAISHSKRKQFLRWKKEKEQNNALTNSNNLLKTSLSASRLHEDYYSGHTNRQKPHKNY